MNLTGHERYRPQQILASTNNNHPQFMIWLVWALTSEVKFPEDNKFIIDIHIDG